MDEQNPELQQWWRSCCAAQDTISEQEEHLKEAYGSLREFTDIATQYTGLIDSQESEIKRLERCLDDTQALPEGEREPIALRLESQIEKCYETWWGLLDERDKVTGQVFYALDSIAAMKQAKEKLEYNAFMIETGRYTAICKQQMQDWVDAGCPDDDGEEWMN